MKEILFSQSFDGYTLEVRENGFILSDDKTGELLIDCSDITESSWVVEAMCKNDGARDFYTTINTKSKDMFYFGISKTK